MKWFEFFLAFVSLIVFLYLLGLILILQKQKRISSFSYSLKNISVIIPFRNEEHSLKKLIDSINANSNFPKEIIFVNDHSTDSSKKRIIDANPMFNYAIIDLEASFSGKKEALNRGVLQATGESILTMDADVVLPENYFEAISHTPKHTLSILPVKMTGENFQSLFAVLDFYFFNAINSAISGINLPISCNGANLLFQKKAFKERSQLHLKYSSGDDLFMLQAMKQQKEEIGFILNPKLSVETKAPSGYREFLHQRLRWIGKTRRVGDYVANSIGFIGLSYQLSFFPILICSEDWYQYILIKILAESILLSYPILFFKQYALLLLCPVFSILYPLYALLMMITSFFIHPSWKNRKVIQ